MGLNRSNRKQKKSAGGRGEKKKKEEIEQKTMTVRGRPEKTTKVYKD